MSWGGIWLAFSGALVIAAGEVKSIQSQAAPQRTLIGILFALASVGTRSLKIVVMDFLLAPMEYASELTPLTEVPLSPMQLYSLQAPWCVLTAFLYAVCTDSFQMAFLELTSQSALLIFLTCLSAVSLNFLGQTGKERQREGHSHVPNHATEVVRARARETRARERERERERERAARVLCAGS